MKYTIDNIRKDPRLQYIPNHQITDHYDQALSVKAHNGTFVGLKTGSVLSFKGIPYAIQPVGDWRFKRVDLPSDDDGVYEAYHFGHSCLQTELFSERASFYEQGEDCLTLNIWTNTKNTSSNKPVMVFIHGGSYGWGGTADPLYDGHNLINKFDDIILVTINYRVGLLGFIDLSSYSDSEGYEESTNLGLYDQITALKWINKNIAAFGGNPDNVTIFGESAGGGSVSLLAVIDEARPYFKRFIAESGSIALTFSKKEAQKLTYKIRKEHHVKSVKQFKEMSFDELKTMNLTLNEYNNFPIRDSRLIPVDLYNEYYQGKASDKDMIIGTMQDEVRYWINEIGGIGPYRLSIPVVFENNIERLSKKDKKIVNEFMAMLDMNQTWKLTEFYNEVMFRVPATTQAWYHHAQGGRTYMYYWKYPSANRHSGACHAVELSYVFNNLDETIYTGNNPSQAIADKIQAMWVNFARHGDPSINEQHWPQYDKNRETMIFDEPCSLVNNPLAKQRELIEPINKYHFNGSYVDLNYNVPSVRRYIRFIIYFIVLFVMIIKGVNHLLKKGSKDKK
ncbi:MAG: carboxylesterase family protein [Erysipelotrichaceae bacterium]|nr:carboxylesterase family protein [Erysipelotrichaceae bacterium]